MKTSTTMKTLRLIGDHVIQIENLDATVILNNAAEEVMDVRLRVNNLHWEIFRNKIMVQGTVFINIIYKGVDDIVYHQPQSIDFSEHVDVPGLSPALKLPHKVIIPLQNPENTIDVQIYVSELAAAFTLDPPFTVNLKVLARLLLKVSRIEQLEVFINGVDGIFHFCNPVTRS